MREYFRFFIVLSLIWAGTAGNGVYAQKQGMPLVDSLLEQLKNARPDTNKVNVLNGLAYSYGAFNAKEGIKFGARALALASQLRWEKGEAWAHNYLGFDLVASRADSGLFHLVKAKKMAGSLSDKLLEAEALRNFGNYYRSKRADDTALGYYVASMKLGEENGFREVVGSAFCNAGSLYLRKGNFPLAMEYFLKAATILEKINQRVFLATTLQQIGSIDYYMGNYKAELVYDLKVLKIHEDLGFKNGMANDLLGVSFCYYNLDDYKNSLKYGFMGLEIAEQTGDKVIIAGMAGNIALAFTKKKSYVNAIEFAAISLRMSSELHYAEDLGWAYYEEGNAYLHLVSDTGKAADMVADSTGKIAEVQLKTLPLSAEERNIAPGREGRLEKAIDFLQKGLDVAIKGGFLDLERVSFEALAKATQLNGEYARSVTFYQNFIAVKDSMDAKDRAEKLTQTSMQFAFDKQRLTDSLKTMQSRKIDNLRIQRQNAIIYAGMCIIVLLTAFSFFIIRERRKSDKLLLNILPAEVANELKAKGATSARHFDNVTVLFTDFVNFTKASEQMSPQALIDELHTSFKAFDEITAKYNIEKIKTIGDAYLAVCGLPLANPSHAQNTVLAAKEIRDFMAERYTRPGSNSFQVRIGIHSGSVVAGIVGVKKFAYDIWGDTVNTAARMEQNSAAGKINISETTYELVKDKFRCDYRGEIEAKGKGVMKMYYVSE